MDKYRYVFKRSDGHAIDYQQFVYKTFSLDDIENGIAREEIRRLYGHDYKLISRDQWTGMTGSDGKEIYHRDHIVKDEYPFFDGSNPNYIGVVEWVYGGWQIIMKCVNPNKIGISDGINNRIDDDGEAGKHFRVIGNEYESKLMEDSNGH
jgi:hypothetical protein